MTYVYFLTTCSFIFRLNQKKMYFYVEIQKLNQLSSCSFVFHCDIFTYVALVNSKGKKKQVL